MMDQVLEFFSDLFKSDSWPPRWYCGEWSDFHGWLYIISDLAIWAAYFAIPLILLYFITRKKNIPFHNVFILFILFILACGTTHLIDALIFWIPVYRVAALARFITAVVSVTTVIVLVKVLPKVLSVRSIGELEAEIANRKIIEKKLKESEQRFRNIFEYSGVSIAVTNLDEIPQIANHTFKEMIGIGNSGMMNKPLSKFLHVDDRQDHVNGLIDLKSGNKESYRTEKRYLNQGNDEIWVDSSMSLIKDINDKPAYFIEVAQDISLKKEALEKISLHSKELEKKNKELEELAYISSHDMKSPINSLDGLIRLLEKKEAIKPESKHIFRMLKESVRDMKKTNKALNDVIKLKKTLDTVEVGEVYFQDVVNDVEKALNQELKTTKTTITKDFSECKKVLFSYVHLKSVIINLVTNSMKYRLENKPPVINIRSGRENDRIFLEIQDNGSGIDMEKYGKKLFKLFSRIHTHIEGSGIGLHMVKSIIESYGGKILIDSEVNKGTTIKIFLTNE